MQLEPCDIAIPLGRIAALRGGEPGQPRLLALHGWLDNAASFVPLAGHLDGVELVAIDLPGHGHSVHLPPGAHYTFELAVHHVLDVAEALGWETFHLLGHSMGAAIASLVAAACPDRVQSLVCIEALGGLVHPADEAGLRLRESVAAARAAGRRPKRVFAEQETAIGARMQANQMSEAMARLLVARGLSECPGGWQWRSDQRLMVPTFMRPVVAQIEAVLAAIACPVKVILAEPAQPYWPEAQRQQFVASLKQGQVCRLPGTHHLHMEDAATVAAQLQGFWQ